MEVIEFYQRQVEILERLLAERDRAAGQSSASSRSPCARADSRRRCLPGSCLPSSSESPLPAVCAVEWRGSGRVEAMRFSFEQSEKTSNWRRIELQRRERIRMLRGRGTGLAEWIVLITSTGRVLQLGGAIEEQLFNSQLLKSSY